MCTHGPFTRARSRYATLSGVVLTLMFALMCAVVADEQRNPVLFTAGSVLTRSKLGAGFWCTALGVPLSTVVTYAGWMRRNEGGGADSINSAEDAMDTGLELEQSTSVARGGGKIVV